MLFEEFKDQIGQIELSDYSSLLNYGRKWKKVTLDNPEGIFNMKIGVLGSTSIQLIVSVFRALLCKYNIYADVYEGEYDGISMDVFDDTSVLYQFNPSYVIVIPDYRDILEQKPKVLASNVEVEEIVTNVTDYYLRICRRLHENLPGCQVLLSNFVEPISEPLGNLEANYCFSQSHFYKMVNLEIVRKRLPYLSIVDVDKIAAYVGKAKWFDESAYYLNKSGFALDNIGYFCDAFARQFEAFTGRIKKCLVLDLDNTIWGGVVGDLGYDGILLDPNDAEGEAFISFQKYLLELKNRGIILAVCSKNDMENAKEPFEKNEHMVLHMEDISAFVANWNDKASNIKTIAKELNIGLDSLVFFDDNPTERALIKNFVPEVKVVEVPEDPALYIKALDQSHCFEWNQITKEDVSRIESYRNNNVRSELLDSCDNYNEFLEKLEMEAVWASVTDATLDRFTQLTNKSNQFNLRTTRYSEAEVEEMRKSDNYGLYTVTLKDKFSNYGIIACVVLKYSGSVCSIENWVMSCRVLKKTVEHFTISKIVETACLHGANRILAEYIQSKKNGMVRDLYGELGFAVTESNSEVAKFVLDETMLKTYKQEYIIKEVQ